MHKKCVFKQENIRKLKGTTQLPASVRKTFRLQVLEQCSQRFACEHHLPEKTYKNNVTNSILNF